MRTTCMTLATIALIGSVAWAGGAPPGQLSAEQALPLAEGRDAYDPDAAWGKDSFLVVWKSGNLAEGDLREGMKYIGDLVACRVDGSGKVLDAKPFVVSAAKDLQEHPCVAFDGKNFLVVWQDMRNGKDWDVYAARVSPDGKVLDTDGVLVAGGKHNQALPDVSWDGKAFQIVWQDYRSDNRYEVYGARVGADGKVLDPQGKVLATEKAPGQRYGPVTAANTADGKSLLFWLASSHDRKMPSAACQWVSGGAPAGGLTFTTSGPRTALLAGRSHANFPICLAAGSGAYFGAWTTHNPAGRGNATNSAHAAVFSKEGKLVKSFLLVGAGGVAGDRIRNPAAAWTGSQFVVAWDQNDRKMAKAAKTRLPVEVIFAAGVSKEGSVSAPVPVSGSVAEPAIRPTVASDGKGATLIAYEKHPKTTETPIKIGVRLLKSK